MTPPNEHASEGGRDDRGVPYHAESTLSGAQVLKLLNCYRIAMLVERDALFKLSTRGFTLRGYAYDETMLPQKRRPLKQFLFQHLSCAYLY